jgi:hypothetical protein
MSFEKLDGALVLFGRGQRLECAQIPSFPGRRIFLS